MMIHTQTMSFKLDGEGIRLGNKLKNSHFFCDSFNRGFFSFIHLSFLLNFASYEKKSIQPFFSINCAQVVQTQIEYYDILVVVTFFTFVVPIRIQPLLSHVSALFIRKCLHKKCISYATCIKKCACLYVAGYAAGLSKSHLSCSCNILQSSLLSRAQRAQTFKCRPNSRIQQQRDRTASKKKFYAFQFFFQVHFQIWIKSIL